MSGVLALDLSKTRTGWCYWRPGWALPRYGGWRLGTEYTTDGGVFAKLHRNMLDLRAVMPFDAIYHEQAINPANLSGNTNLRALYLAAGLAAHVESFAHAMGCRVFAINISNWRADFVGRDQVNDARAKARALRKAGDSRAAARGELKALTMARCRQLGMAPKSDDEGDAIGILDYALWAHEQVTVPWRADEVLRAPLEVAR